jgi:hypothetical protein
MIGRGWENRVGPVGQDAGPDFVPLPPFPSRERKEMFMSRSTWVTPLTIFALVAGSSPALPCTLCGGNPQAAGTIRQAAAQAKLILYGTMANPRLNPDGAGPPGSGTTDFHIERVFKTDPILGSRKVIEVPRYIPVDAKARNRFLLFCDVYNNQFDPFRGMPVKAATVDYVKGAMALDAKDPVRALLFFFHYLDHPDPELANDAFVEFSRANDQEIGQVAARLSPDKIRRLLGDKKTPAERLGLYAFLLGACGGAGDADLLRSLIVKPTEQTSKALDGILSGYIQLRPREGWALAVAILGDARKPFPDRFAVLRTLRFYHSWKPRETEPEVLRGLAAMVPHGDIADMAIEDLRRWQLWDLTGLVLQQFGKKTHDAPILRRAIVRYALSCPRVEAAQFVAALKKLDPDLVADVQESLEFEKGK